MVIFGLENGLTRIEHLKGSRLDWFLHGAPTEAVYNRLGTGANDITCILRGAMTNSTNVVVFKMLPNVQKIHFFISNAESDSIIMIQLRNKSQTKILLRLHFSNNSTTQKNVITNDITGLWRYRGDHGHHHCLTSIPEY